MSKGGKIGCIVLVVVALLIIVLGLNIKNMYNGLVGLDEGVNNAWSEVQNQYQRRYDLIPNLVETVRGYAAHERETLEAVIEARSKVGGVIQMDAEDLTPANLARYQELQQGLSGALQRLMVVVEQYPNLKANENFIRLQDELAGTENRITVARNRFNETVQSYNQTIRKFPQMLVASLLGFSVKPYFDAVTEAQQAPKVQF